MKDATRALANESDAAVLQRLLETRHSCRAFLPAPVPRQTMERWLRLAQRAASWCNTQPWQLVVTEGAATQRFREALLVVAASEPGAPDIPFPAEYRGSTLARRREVGAQLYGSVGIARGDHDSAAQQMRENFRLFGAPHVAILTSDRLLGTYGAVDCGVYIGTLMLAAQALGLGCIAQASIARYPAFIRRHFGLAEDRCVVCALSFGFADTEHPVNRFRSTRAVIDEVVSWVEDGPAAAPTEAPPL